MERSSRAAAWLLAIGLTFGNWTLLADEADGRAAISNGRSRGDSSLSAKLRTMFGRGQPRVNGPKTSAAEFEAGRLRSTAEQAVAMRQVRAADPASSIRSGEPPPAVDSPPATLDLAALEQVALANNPTLVQAQAAIDAAGGRRLQVGLSPNPTIGYIGSEIGNEGRAGQQGMSLSQEIVRGGKLQLNRAVAFHELEQAQARLEAQRNRVLNSVGTAYYNTLAAERILAYYAAVVTLRGQERRFPGLRKPPEIDQTQPPLVEKTLKDAQELRDKGELAAAKVLPIELEVDQLRIRAENAAADYTANWKRLAALVGMPDLQKPDSLDGKLEEGLLVLDREEELSRILLTSPELRVAEAGVRRAADALSRSRVQPIPNVTLDGSVQYDSATRDTIIGASLSLPLPIYNRNQGNILAAEAEVVRATRERDRIRLSLAERFADAFGRYEKAREQVKQYRELLPKARKSYTQTIEAYRQVQANPSDLILVQRQLVDYHVAYPQALGALHASIIEIKGLLLTDGLNGEATTPVDGVSGGRE